MKILSAHFDDEENVKSVNVSMSIEELAAIYRVFGSLSPTTIHRVVPGSKWAEAFDELCEGAGNILNTYFDDGVNDVAPKFGVVDLGEAQAQVDIERGKRNREMEKD